MWKKMRIGIYVFYERKGKSRFSLVRVCGSGLVLRNTVVLWKIGKRNLVYFCCFFLLIIYYIEWRNEYLIVMLLIKDKVEMLINKE